MSTTTITTTATISAPSVAVFQSRLKTVPHLVSHPAQWRCLALGTLIAFVTNCYHYYYYDCCCCCCCCYRTAINNCLVVIALIDVGHVSGVLPCTIDAVPFHGARSPFARRVVRLSVRLCGATESAGLENTGPPSVVLQVYKNNVCEIQLIYVKYMFWTKKKAILLLYTCELDFVRVYVSLSINMSFPCFPVLR